MLSEHALTTIEAVRQQLGLDPSDTSQDAVLVRLINSASDAIRSYCDRDFARARRADRLEGSGRPVLLLPLYPVIRVESVTADGIPVSPEEYDVDAPAGRLIRRSGSWPGGPGLTVEVVYEAGYITPEQARKGVGERDLPYDLEEACIATVMSWYSRRSMPADVQSFWVEQIRVNFDTQREWLPTPVQRILDRYRRYG